MLYGLFALVFLTILFASLGHGRMRARAPRKDHGMGWPRENRDAKLIGFIGFAVFVLMFVAATLAYSLIRP
jgi:hypothetical protein